jgi:DNA replication protein DnaC
MVNLDEIFSGRVDGFALARNAKNVTIVCEKHGKKEVGNFWNGKEVKQQRCPQCAIERDEQVKAEELKEEAHRAKELHSKALELAFGRACIPPRFSERTLENYQVVNEAAGKALSVVRQYADNFEVRAKTGSSLLLLGDVGTGKTHLAIGVANAIIPRGYSAIYVTVMDMMRHIKDTWGSRSDQSESQAINDFIKPDLLILDEAGVQFGSETERMLIGDIIDTRYREQKPAIVISNLTLSEITKLFGERAIDRLRDSGGQAVEFKWPSYRSGDRRQKV